MTPLGLYVHIPFCETKCGYCDFYSVPVGDRATAPLVDAVLHELHARLADSNAAQQLTLRTIFVGGGTPTLLEAEQLRRLMQTLGRIAREHAVVEFTVEANPATVDDQKAALLVEHGVTRVSMGAQSFFPNELASLERLHSPADIAPSVEVLRRNGVGQINLDLIFGIPGQTLDTWSESLRRAVDLAPDHLACYGLTYEPATRLTAQRNHGLVTPCDETLEARMHLRTLDQLATAGYEQYEISNFARPGRRCQHNLIYWRNEAYLGVGPSAAGCLGRRRYKNVPDLAAYTRWMAERGHAEGESETLDDDQVAIEMVMMQLRLSEGLSPADFRRRLGVDPLELYASGIGPLKQEGLIEATTERMALTRSGQLLANPVIARIVSSGTIHPRGSARGRRIALVP